MESGKITIFIIDNDIEWVKKLTILINREDEMIVVGASGLKNEVCSLIQMMEPNIILLDVFSGNSSWEGIEMIRVIREISNSKIIILTINPDPELVKKTLYAGAKDYIIKENERMLPEIIRVIAKRWSTAEIMTQMVKEFGSLVIERRKEEILRKNNLTPSECRIFNCLERHLTRLQIAQELDISESTVKNHITNILRKINVENANEAVNKINRML